MLITPNEIWMEFLRLLRLLACEESDKSGVMEELCRIIRHLGSAMTSKSPLYLEHDGDADLHAKSEPSNLDTYVQADGNPAGKTSSATCDCEFSASGWLDAFASEERFGVSFDFAE